mgnify:CR=1 FL=1
MSTTTFSVRVIGLQGEVFSGEVLAVSSTNEQGTFDILPEHTNFIALIQDQVELLISPEKTKSFELKTGVIRCKNGQVEVVLGVDSQLSHELEK